MISTNSKKVRTPQNVGLLGYHLNSTLRGPKRGKGNKENNQFPVAKTMNDLKIFEG